MSLFTEAALAALRTVGVSERWAAVQEQLHPRLVSLVTRVEAEATQRFPRQWPLHEVSYKSQRYLNRGRGGRSPIEDYWVAFDRPPRGSGVLVTVSETEQAILVGIQLWKVRKPTLRQVWSTGQPIWQPLVERIQREGQARFAGLVEQSDENWIAQYLGNRNASYLWAGFVYPWNDLPANLDEQLIDDVLALFPLNEALMEQVEALEPYGAALLREQRAAFTPHMVMPPIETIIERIHAQGFTLNDLTIRGYHVALQTRPLVILPGISGTGKTRLTRLYADAVYNIAAPTQPNPFYLVVAVQPDWHNARDLLGYYNALTNVYHPTPFLRFLLQAAADPQNTYFVCLDEMNLARPEYYLAPLLSAMETAEHSFDIGAPAAEAQSVTGEVIPNPLRLPLNVRLIGTVNVDESTYALSDKLLDRANVIELTDVDLDAFRMTYAGPVDADVWQTIQAVHAIVAQAGQAFGYRTITEMLRYVDQARGALTPEQALDLQIKQKVLPKLRGEDNVRLRRALGEVLALTLNVPQSKWQRAGNIAPAQLAAARYPESAAKLQRMLERLDQDGFTDFYG